MYNNDWKYKLNGYNYQLFQKYKDITTKSKFIISQYFNAIWNNSKNTTEFYHKWANKVQKELKGIKTPLKELCALGLKYGSVYKFITSDEFQTINYSDEIKAHYQAYFFQKVKGMLFEKEILLGLQKQGFILEETSNYLIDAQYKIDCIAYKDNKTYFIQIKSYHPTNKEIVEFVNASKEFILNHNAINKIKGFIYPGIDNKPTFKSI